MAEFIALLIIIIVLAGTIFYLYRKMKRDNDIQKTKSSNLKFNHLLEKRNYSPEEIKLIQAICDHYNLINKGDFLVDRDTFNRLTTQYIQEYGSQLDNFQKESVYRFIGEIRKKNHFHQPIIGQSLSSTHEIEINQNISIHYHGQRYNCYVIENLEPYIIVSKPEDGGELPINKLITVSFWRPYDGHYDIKTSIAKEFPDPLNLYCIRHVNDVEISYHRKFLRLETSIPCRFHTVTQSYFIFNENSDEKKGKGTIINLSGGGVALKSHTKLSTNDYILMEFKVSHNLELKGMKGIILESEKQDEEYIYHINFIGISHSLQHKLIYHIEAVYELKKDKPER